MVEWLNGYGLRVTGYGLRVTGLSQNEPMTEGGNELRKKMVKWLKC